MSRAIPTIVRKGKNTSAIYAKIKNGNVYKLNTPIAPEQVNWAIAMIKKAGKIQLKHWEAVRIKQPARLAEEIEHANKMCAFEKSGDKAGAIAYLNARTASSEPEHDLPWEAEMQDEWQMGCDSPMVEQMLIQQADSGVAS